MFDQLNRNLRTLSSVQGVTSAKLLSLPPSLRGVINKLMEKGRREKITLAELVAVLKLSEPETLKVAEILIEKGYLYGLKNPETGQLVYGVRFDQKRGRDLPLALKAALQSLKSLQLIEVKSDIGASKRGADLGSDALKIASCEFNRKFFYSYPSIEIQSEQYLPSLAIATPCVKGIEVIYEVYQKISEAVKSSLEKGVLPIVISGDRSTAGGTIAGIKMAFPESRLGVVWIDAHADIHTPYTTPSGNMHEMPVATAVAEDNLACQVNQFDGKTADYWNKIKQLGGIAPKLAYEDLIYVAVLDTEPQEDYLIIKHQIKNFTTAEVKEKGVAQVVREVMERLQDCDRIYISFDVDSIDPVILSEGMGTPVTGGLTDTEAGQLISRLIQQGKVCCFEICEINPVYPGRGNRMAQSAFGILENAANKLSAH
jgi:arginase